MKSLLILTSIFSSFAWSQEPPPSNLKYGLGMGFESRYQAQVNTALSENRVNPEFFLRGQLDSYALHLNVISYSETSSIGALLVERQVLEFMPWLRYEFSSQRLFEPFLGLGLGFASQRVRTQLGETADIRQSDPELQYGLLAGLMFRGQNFKNVFFESSTKWVMLDRSRQTWWAFNFALGVEL